MKPQFTKVEGVDYSPEGIEDIRNFVIAVRDEALRQNEFHWVAPLSHAVALLAAFKSVVEQQKEKEPGELPGSATVAE